jgi:hypothetical protein
MTNREIEKKVRKHTLEIKKDFMALKVWKEEGV